MNIVVYCSSRENLPQQYVNTAQIAGEMSGSNNCTLLYGGVDAGMMHVTAEYTAKQGGKITGVVPDFFKHRADTLLTTTIVARSLSERKEIMIDGGDLFIVLPGGLGTIDEWLSTLAHIEVTHDEQRKIIIVNIDGLYDEQIKQLSKTANSSFARSDRFMDINIIANASEEFCDVLNAQIQEYGKK